MGADAFGVAARLYARPIAVAIKWRPHQRIPALVWSRGNSRCGHRVTRAKSPSQRNRFCGLRSVRWRTTRRCLFIVVNEADCCSTKHNACSDYGRVEGCASASDADLPRVALEGGLRAKLQRGQIILEFRRTRGVEASTPSVSRRRIRRARPAPALPDPAFRQ